MRYVNENVGQYAVSGNVFPELPWALSKLTLSAFISKRLAEASNETICGRCQSHLRMGESCYSCE